MAAQKDKSNLFHLNVQCSRALAEDLMNNFPFKYKKLNRIWIGCGVLIASALVSPMSFAQPAPIDEGVAAIVNDEPITYFDVRQRTRYLLIRQKVSQVTEEIIKMASDQALSSLINERLQLQEAAKFKVKMSDEEVDQILANQAKGNGSTIQDLFKELNAAGLSIKAYRDSVRAEVLWQKIVMGRYGSRVKISPEQVAANWERIQASADKPQYQVSEIFIEVAAENEDAGALNGAKTIVEKIRAGESFGAYAEEYSYAPSAATSGDLGWVVLGELRPEVAAVIDTIPVGQVSEPIKVQGGYMIIGVRAKHDSTNLSTSLNLKEIVKAIPANADENQWKKINAAFSSAKSQFNGNCKDLDKIAKANGLKLNNLGTVQENELLPQIKTEIAKLKKGETTPVMNLGKEAVVTVLCDKVVTGADIPTKAQIEDQMHDSELSLIARRYLRDLRREAAIIQR